MHKPESVQVNETYKTLRDIEKRMDLIKQARRPNLDSIDNCHKLDFAAPGEVKMKESEKINKFLNLDIELKKLLNIRLTVIRIIVYTQRTAPRSLKK